MDFFYKFGNRIKGFCISVLSQHNTRQRSPTLRSRLVCCFPCHSGKSITQHHLAAYTITGDFYPYIDMRSHPLERMGPEFPWSMYAGYVIFFTLVSLCNVCHTQTTRGRDNESGAGFLTCDRRATAGRGEWGWRVSTPRGEGLCAETRLR